MNFFLNIKYYLFISFCMLCMFTSCRQKDAARPVRKDIIDAVFGSGTIQQKAQYTVASTADGYLKAVYITEGDSVKRGKHLFQVSNEISQSEVENALANYNYARQNTSSNAPQAAQLKVQINQALEKYHIDSLNYLRYQRLVKTQAVSTADYENTKLTFQASATNIKVLQHSLNDLERTFNLNLENARSQYAIQQDNDNFYTNVSATNGLVLEVDKKKGDYIKKGDIIAKIGAGAPYIKLYIAEDDILRVKQGQLVLISLNSIKEKVFKATVTKLVPFFDNTQQAFTLEATFADPPKILMNGTQLQANIIVEEKKQALVIPSNYLTSGDYVQVKGINTMQPVKAGIRTLEWTEILSGLNEQDVLIQPK